MSLIVVDIESDDQSPAIGSMVCFGAVVVSDMSKTFYGETKPIMDTWNPEALAISGFSREEHEKFDDPKEVMEKFAAWLKEVSPGKRPVFISDNPAFDWQWINFYFHKYVGENPFGFSGRRIGDLYCGLVKDASKNHEWKRKYRKTSHTHNPVDDAMGNAEAIVAFKEELGLKIKL
jgi:hypothetical protein